MSAYRHAAFALACVALAAAGPPVLALEPTQVFERVAPSVWVVRTFDAEERRVGQGSAVVIAPGRLVTNCHVLAKSKTVMVRRANVMYEAKLEHADAPRDLCLLKVAGFDAPAAQLRPVEDLKVGERVYAVGNPQGFEVTLSEGLISGLRGELPGLPVDQGGGEVIQTTAPISAGSSGGGLFDAEGRLVGITSLIRRDAQNINIALPTDWLAQVPERAQAALAKRESHMGGAANAGPGLPSPGTSWAYQFVEQVFSRKRIEVTVRIMNVDGTTVEEAVTTNAPGVPGLRRIVNAREPRFLEFPLSSSDAIIELSPYLVAVNEGKAPAGMPNVEGYPLGSVGLPKWDASAEVRGWEQVTVPAGTFRALRVAVAGRRSTAIGGRTAWAGRFEMNVWYAPDVNRIVREEQQVWTADGISPMLAAHEVLELISYHPPQ